MTTFICENCKCKLRANESAQTIRCPKCKHVTTRTVPILPILPKDDINQTEEIIIDKTQQPAPSPDASELLSSFPLSQTHELGPYAVKKEIGRGGMGLILQGYDAALQREVAIKTLHPKMRQDPIKRSRFIKEAQITGQLEHPGIVPVHYFGKDEHDQVFFSMKLATGQSLGKILHSWHKGESKLLSHYPLIRMLSIFERICETVGFAHSRHIIHRDLKPDNIMLGTHGEVWVLDWGLAKVIGHDEPSEVTQNPSQPLKMPEVLDSHLTLDGMVVGTPEYMAPEQAAGEELDEGVDIFALGAILYEILTSQTPRTGSNANEIVSRAAQGRFVPVRRTIKGKKVHPALAAITEKCLHAQRKHRYKTVEDLLQDLRRYAAGQEVLAAPDTLPVRITRFVRRHRTAMTLSGAIVALLLLIVTVASVLIAKKDRETHYVQSVALAAIIDKQKAEEEQLKAEREKQSVLTAGAEKAQRRLKAFGPYSQAMDLLLRGQLPEKSASLLEDSLTIDAEFPEARYALAEAYRSSGLPAKAAEAYLQANELSLRISGQPNLHAILSAGFTYDGAGQYDKANECFALIIKANSNDPLSKVGNCFLQAYQKHWPLARSLADDALKTGSHLWESHFASGYVFLESTSDGLIPPIQGRLDAIAAFRKAIELSPRQAENFVWLSKALLIGNSSENELLEAIRCIERAITLEPLNGIRYLARASNRLRNGDTQGAESDFKEAKRLNTWEDQLHMYLSAKASRAGDSEKSFQEISHCMKSTPHWPSVTVNWLFLGMQLNKTECLPMLETLKKENPDYVYVPIIEGYQAELKKDTLSASKFYKKASELAPYNLKALSALGRLYLTNTPKEALDIFDKILFHYPHSETTLLSKAQALLNLNRHAEALEIIKQLSNAKDPSIKTSALKALSEWDSLIKKNLKK